LIPLDDRTLGEQVRRRAGGDRDSGPATDAVERRNERIAALVASRILATAQSQPGIVGRLLPPAITRGKAVAASGWIAAALVIATAVAVGPSLVRAPASGPPGSEVETPVSTAEARAPGWYLTGAELISAVAEARLHGSLGRVVVTDATLEPRALGMPDPEGRCQEVGSGAGGPVMLKLVCPISMVIEGSSPQIVVDGIPGYPTCARCLFRVPDPGPYAVEIAAGGTRLTYLGRVALPPGASAAWSVSRASVLIGPGRPMDAALLPVDGWISGMAGQPRCLMISDPDRRYGCGPAAWLTDVPVQPNTLSGNTYSLEPPLGGIRIQNEAYSLFAPGPAASPGVFPEPRHGVFLIREVVLSTDCFGCPESGGLAEVVARLDPP
jgi:hypothetical protein